MFLRYEKHNFWVEDDLSVDELVNELIRFFPPKVKIPRERLRQIAISNKKRFDKERMMM